MFVGNRYACAYIFRNGKENKFKIGHTKKSAKVRLKELQTGNPDLTFYDVIETKYDTAVENYIQRRLATKKIITGSSSDEFYAVSVAELQPIIAEAHDYNREYLPMIEQAEVLGAEKPDGSIKEGNAARSTQMNYVGGYRLGYRSNFPRKIVRVLLRKWSKTV